MTGSLLYYIPSLPLGLPPQQSSAIQANTAGGARACMRHMSPDSYSEKFEGKPPSCLHTSHKSIMGWSCYIQLARANTKELRMYGYSYVRIQVASWYSHACVHARLDARIYRRSLSKFVRIAIYTYIQLG